MEMVLQSFNIMAKITEYVLSVQETVLLLCKNSKDEDRTLKVSIDKLETSKR